MKTLCARLPAVFRIAGAQALALVAFATTVHAQTVMLSNLDEEAGGHGSFANYTTEEELYVWNVASDFTTGSEETTLQSITLSFDQYSVGSGFALSLYSDGGGQPGALLETLSGSGAPNEATTYDYVSSGTILEAGTTYWWVGTVEAGQFNYYGTYSSSEVSPAGWTIGNFSAYTQLNGGDWESTGGAQVRFAVSVVSAVPEPASSGVLAGLASLGFLLVRRRSRRANQ